MSGSNTTSYGPQIPDLLGKSGNSVQLSLTIDSGLKVNELYSSNIVTDRLEKSSATIEFSKLCDLSKSPWLNKHFTMTGTYDVQAVSIDSIPGGLELSCTFASGSQARSCVLTVCRVENEVIDEGSCVNISTITRNEQSISTQQITNLQPGHVYILKEVAEVESDGSVTIMLNRGIQPQYIIVEPSTISLTTRPGNLKSVMYSASNVTNFY